MRIFRTEFLVEAKQWTGEEDPLTFLSEFEWWSIYQYRPTDDAKGIIARNPRGNWDPVPIGTWFVTYAKQVYTYPANEFEYEFYEV